MSYLYHIRNMCSFLVNVIMLVVMLSNKDLQTPTNILLCSVAIADICYLVINPTSTVR